MGMPMPWYGGLNVYALALAGPGRPRIGLPAVIEVAAVVADN